jgi:hypothetical protein
MLNNFDSMLLKHRTELRTLRSSGSSHSPLQQNQWAQVFLNAECRCVRVFGVEIPLKIYVINRVSNSWPYNIIFIILVS